MSVATVEIYDFELDQWIYKPARQALRESLNNLRTPTLDKIRLALIEEPYICVGNWANCSIEEGKPVGCLFTAAYMHTAQFEVDLDTFSGNMRETMRAFEDEGLFHAAESLNESDSAVDTVIQAFDTWGGQKSKSRLIDYKFVNAFGDEVDASERVLLPSARRELLQMIDEIIESRPSQGLGL